MVLTPEQVAQMLHGLTSVIDRPDGSQVVRWDELDAEDRARAAKAVVDIMNRESLSVIEAHNLWASLKIEAGWVYGKQHCTVNKTHPCLVPYEELPVSERIKDEVWVYITNLLKEYTKW